MILAKFSIILSYFYNLAVILSQYRTNEGHAI